MRKNNAKDSYIIVCVYVICSLLALCQFPLYANSKNAFPQDWNAYINKITHAKYPNMNDNVEDENLKVMLQLIEDKYYEQITGDKDIREIVKSRKNAFDLILKTMERYKNNRYREAVIFLAYQLGATLPDLKDYSRLQRIKKRLLKRAFEIIRKDYYDNGITLFTLLSPLDLCDYMSTTKDRPIWYDNQVWRSKNHLRLNSQSYYNEILNLQRVSGETIATDEALRISSLRMDFNNMTAVYYFAWKFSHGTKQIDYARKIQGLPQEAIRDYEFNDYAKGYIATVNKWLSRKLRAEIRTVGVESVPAEKRKAVYWERFRFNLENNPVVDVVFAPELQIAWRTKLGSPILSSPAITRGMVYVGTGDGLITALDANTGRKMWSYYIGMPVDSSPLINNNILYVGDNDGYVYSLDLANRNVKWKTAVGDSCISSPAFYNDRIYVGSYSYKSRMYCLDAKTGEILWSQKTMNAIYSSPAIAKGVVYVGSCGGILYAYDALNGDIIWKYDMLESIYASPCLVDDKVFIGSWAGEFVALNAKTGKLLWSIQTSSPINAGAISSEGMVSFATDGGTIYGADVANGALAWKFDTKHRIFSSPIIIGKNIYYLTWDDNLYVIDLESGKELSRFHIGNQVNGSLAYYGRLLYFGTDMGDFYALEEK